ncbi:hypothetical protein ZTR_06929 [Talaromyces verruculosus]|nr:hypothetical protein ZTR_06929 [Talaromyces verruculosus]
MRNTFLGRTVLCALIWIGRPVKAKKRQLSVRGAEIVMQDCAEMAGWFLKDMDSIPMLNGHLPRFQRHLPRGFAKCHPDYLAYLKTGKVTANAFLTMQTYGPYEITSQKDMRDIANAMTAVIVVAKMLPEKCVQAYVRNRIEEENQRMGTNCQPTTLNFRDEVRKVFSQYLTDLWNHLLTYNDPNDLKITLEGLGKLGIRCESLDLEGSSHRAEPIYFKPMRSENSKSSSIDVEDTKTQNLERIVWYYGGWG